ncbi:helix-turn-helix transcriptional regulator [Rhizobium mesosinicum]|uniref:Helix-turn-helix transcriptional regulator n=1 Tax=Rhizobium mesosinicum TaxID=335017 RepID=A0ABS7GNW4_9HYPH|nr:AraC family transcriptional regulator [Rhizobium mesosinicum]MBW9051100.1 helix-turn-helix transcriptional regulator [Rhizobium mesosinicum]
MAAHGSQMARYIGSVNVESRQSGSGHLFTATHIVSKGLGREMTSPIPVEASYIASVQIKPITRHELWKSGKLSNSIPYLKDSLSVVHLAEEPRIYLPEAFECLQLHLPESALRSYAEANHDTRTTDIEVKPGEIDRVLAHLAQALLPSLHDKGRVGDLYFEQLTLAMVSQILNGHTVPQTLKSASFLSRAQLSKAKELMALTPQISLLDIARECDFPASRFATAFRAAEGVSPSQWQRRERLEQAKQLLTGSSLSLKAIAERCGYADQGHFTRAFSSGTGVTPGAWRRDR